MSTRLIRFLAVATAALHLTGCVIVVDGDEDDVEAGWASTYAKEADARREENAALAERVTRRIEELPDLADEDLTVSASGEVVTLYGRLDEPARLIQAIDAARDVPGVARVVSRVTLDVRR